METPSPLNFQTSKAQASHSIKGKTIDAGDNKSRLQLDKSDSRCHIAALKKLDDWWTFSGIVQHFTYTKAEIQGKELYVNIESVSSRLHTDSESVQYLGENNPQALGDFIVRQTAALTKALPYYKQIFQNYQQNTDGFLIDKEILMDVVKIAITTLNDNESIAFKSKNKFFYASKAEGKFQIYQLKHKLGEGSFAFVHQLKQIPIGKSQPAVLKLAKHSSANIDITNSFEIRIIIHQDGLLPGIQPLPLHEVTWISQNKDQKGLIEVYAEGDLHETSKKGKAFNKLGSLEKMNAWQSVLQSMKIVKEKNIAHSDIKTKNFLLYKNNGKFSIALSDWGGAKQLNKLDEIDKQFSLSADKAIALKQQYKDFDDLLGTHTPKCVPHELLLKGRKAFDEGRIDDLKDILFQIDVFGIGLSIYRSLLGKKPKIQFINDPSNKDKYVKKVTIEKMGNSHHQTLLADLLQRMCTSDKKQQPSIEEVEKQFSGIIKGWPISA